MSQPLLKRTASVHEMTSSSSGGGGCGSSGSSDSAADVSPAPAPAASVDASSAAGGSVASSWGSSGGGGGNPCGRESPPLREASPARTAPALRQRPASFRAGAVDSTGGGGGGGGGGCGRRMSNPAAGWAPESAAADAASDAAIDQLFASNSFDEMVNSLHRLLSAHPTEQAISRDRVIESLREAGSHASSEFLLSDPGGLRQAVGTDADDYANSSLLRKLTRFPGTFVDQTLEVAARQGGFWIMSLLPIHEVVTLMLLLLSRWLNADLLQQLGWLALFYCSLAAMLACSFRVLHALVTDRRRGKPIRRAVKRLLSDAGAEERAAAARRLARRGPSGQHCGLAAAGCLAACLCSAVAYSLCSHMLVPASEMLLLSCLLGLLLLLYGGGDKRHRTAKLAFMATSLYAGLPALLGSGAPSLPRWLAWAMEPAAVVQVPLVQLRLAASLPAAAKLASLACLAVMAPCRSAVPSVLAAAWWHFGLLFAQEATAGGVLRLAAGLCLAFTWLPLVGAYCLVALLAHMPTALAVYLWQASGLVVLLLLSVVMIYGVQNGLTIGRTNLKRDCPTLYRACLAAFFTACCLIPFVLYWLRGEPVESLRPMPSLSYEQFSQVCCQRGWSCHNNRVEVQTVCAHLEGVRVYWQGTVRGVAIGRTDNKMKDFVKFLPAFLHRLFACTYGRPYVCDNATVARFGPALCEALAEQKACHLEDYNDHTYHISLSPKLRYPNSTLTTYAQVVLLAPSGLRDQAQLLTAGHRVRFSGVIEDTLSDPAKVKLRTLDCSNCVWTLRSAKAKAKATAAAAAAHDDDDDDDDDLSLWKLLTGIAEFCLQPLIL